MMTLTLRQLPSDRVRGIYAIRGKPDRMPDRALFLHPLAAESYLSDLAEHVTVSDMLRSAESSLAAVRAGRGAQPPGFSLHNFGVAIDLSLGPTMKRLGFKKKQDLDTWMLERGWWCHRVDGEMKHEAWHYNYLRAGRQLDSKPVSISPKVKSTAGYGEALIVRLYGTQLSPDDVECQALLRGLKMYAGAIDGDVGPQTKESVRALQRAWGVKETGALDARTRRTLAFVSAQVQLVMV